MNLKILALAVLLSTQAQAKLVVHEWGTFTSLVGSNGQAQHGMYYEDEQLPDFVHNFGEKPAQFQFFTSPVGAFHQPLRDPSCPRPVKVPCDFLVGQTITQKMETPVVYFYSDKAQQVSFDVSFPGGIISQSFPAPLKSRPEPTPGVELKNGFAHYEVNILKDSAFVPPYVESTNIYSHARNVGSDLIQVGSEVEKFIFYRGLGEFNSKLQTTSRKGGLRLFNSGLKAMPAAFLIFNDGAEHRGILSLGRIDTGKVLSVDAHAIQTLKAKQQSAKQFLNSARTQLLQALTKEGLFQDEARAMVDTWEHGYFQTPGLRVLYVFGSDEVESLLPIQVSPQPDDLTRVFVGRIEVLLDSEETALLAEILKVGRSFDVSKLGRMAEPILLRIREVMQSKGILTDELSATIDALIARIQ